MKINGGILAAVPAVMFAGVALAQQYPIMERVADKVIPMPASRAGRRAERSWQRRRTVKRSR
jgi:hypothetical protein